MRQLLRDVLIIVGIVAVIYLAWPHVAPAIGLDGQTAVQVQDRQPAQIIPIQVQVQPIQAPAGVGYQAQPPAQPQPPASSPDAPGLTDVQADRIQRDLAEMQAAIAHLGQALKQCQAVYGASRCGQIEGQIQHVMTQQRALLVAAAQASGQ